MLVTNFDIKKIVNEPVAKFLLMMAIASIEKAPGRWWLPLFLRETNAYPPSKLY